MTFIKELSRNNTKISDFVSGLIGFVLDALYIKHGISLDEYPPEFVTSIKSFFKTFYQNQWLQNTCVKANILTPFDCGMTDEVLAKGTQFYQNTFKLYQSDTVYIMRKEMMESGKVMLRDQSYVGTTNYSTGVNAMLRGAGISTKANAEQLFAGTYTYYKNNWSVK